MASSSSDVEVGGGGSGGGAMVAEASVAVQAFQIDNVYEFSAPRFFDFLNEETAEGIRKAELWFETALSYAHSPFVMQIKGGRSFFPPESLSCDLGYVEQPQLYSTKKEEDGNPKESAERTRESLGCHQQEKHKDEEGHTEQVSESKNSGISSIQVNGYSPIVPVGKSTGDETSIPVPVLSESRVTISLDSGACTPKAPCIPGKGAGECGSKSNYHTAKKIPNRKPSATKPKDQAPSTQSATTKQKGAVRCPGSIGAKKVTATDIAQENQAIKRQKLEEGRSLKIHNVKNRVLIHKSKPGLTSDGDIFASAKGRHHEQRRKETTPFISAAEIVQQFQSKTREIEISQNRCYSHEDIKSMIQRRPKLTLTRPKNPELETAHRVRAVRIKNTAELEEEMLAKIPKFKARPVSKKLLEAPSLPAPQRSTPQPPEFQVFQLKTMERASRNAGTSSSSVLSSSIDSTSQDHVQLPKLTEPKPPHLETSLRARPPKAKTSEELELEKLEKIPKFKARPLNKKIFESRGDLGLFCNAKRQITTPQEFHFSTDDRMGPSASVADLFDRLSLHSEAHSEQLQLPRMTTPNPFYLQTEERGLDKERHMSLRLLHKELEEEKARIPKANPYPYTTDYPVIPPKPAPKECTKPEAFQLESLLRHEDAMQRKMEEKERMEKEAAQRKLFRAQPIMNVDPFPIPKKERKPLTEVQEFVHHVEHRATDRSEFDKKIKEKETLYKRMRDEFETAKMIEEEKTVKQMRKTMMPHARPLPNFDNPFLPQKSTKEATKPKSPVLNVAQRVVVRRQHGQPGSISQMR